MTPHTALVLANLAEAYKETGQTEIAVLYANQADIALADGKSAPVLRTDVLNTLGRVYRDLSEAMTAVERHAKALSLARDSRYAIGEAAALAGLAACCDDPASARTYRASADAIFDRHHAPAAVRSA
jgi:tetratricopeptide (TPR) repeat protein